MCGEGDDAEEMKETDYCEDCPEKSYWPNCDENFPCPYMEGADL